MPITTIGSYLSTADEFTSHWDDVNTELGGTPATDLTLQGGYTRADMIAERGTLQALITDLEDKENDRQIASSSLGIQREETRGKLSSFRGMMQGLLPGTPLLAAAPKLPPRDAAESKFLGPLDDMASLWAKVNATTTIVGFTPPLLLAGGYDLASFVSDLADLRAMFLALTTAENDLRVARKQRDALLPKLRARMVQYRVLVEATFGEGHALVLSLPSLSPSSGGAPPATSVTLAGDWNETSEVAELSWTESTDPNLASYSLRASAGAVYDPASETLVETLSPGELSAETTAGLTTPGDVVSFRVYVVLSSGDEIGSNSVAITRL